MFTTQQEQQQQPLSSILSSSSYDNNNNNNALNFDSISSSSCAVVEPTTAMSSFAQQFKHQGNNNYTLIQFPVKLHQILSNVEVNGLSHIVSWGKVNTDNCLNGSVIVVDAFVIHDQKKFVDIIIPKYFKSGMSKYSSFLRQLNLYGFTRSTKGIVDNTSNNTTTTSRSIAYYHINFKRSEPHLCLSITRTKIKGMRKRNNNNKKISHPSLVDAAVSSRLKEECKKARLSTTLKTMLMSSSSSTTSSSSCKTSTTELKNVNSNKQNVSLLSSLLTTSLKEAEEVEIATSVTPERTLSPAMQEENQPPQEQQIQGQTQPQDLCPVLQKCIQFHNNNLKQDINNKDNNTMMTNSSVVGGGGVTMPLFDQASTIVTNSLAIQREEERQQQCQQEQRHLIVADDNNDETENNDDDDDDDDDLNDNEFNLIINSLSEIPDIPNEDAINIYNTVYNNTVLQQPPVQEQQEQKHMEVSSSLSVDENFGANIDDITDMWDMLDN